MTKHMTETINAMLLTLCILLIGAGAANASPMEAKGIVETVIAGNVFQVSGLGCVKLADVSCKSPDTEAGLHAKMYTMDRLQNVQVFLDLDDKKGKDESGCWIAVVYLPLPNGTANSEKIYNDILVKAGHAVIADDKENEFNPFEW